MENKLKISSYQAPFVETWIANYGGIVVCNNGKNRYTIMPLTDIEGKEYVQMVDYKNTFKITSCHDNIFVVCAKCLFAVKVNYKFGQNSISGELDDLSKYKIKRLLIKARKHNENIWCERSYIDPNLIKICTSMDDEEIVFFEWTNNNGRI